MQRFFKSFAIALFVIFIASAVGAQDVTPVATVTTLQEEAQGDTTVLSQRTSTSDILSNGYTQLIQIVNETVDGGVLSSETIRATESYIVQTRNWVTQLRQRAYEENNPIPPVMQDQLLYIELIMIKLQMLLPIYPSELVS